MFRALYFKELKEKALLFFFELAILALLISGAQSVFREKKDIREWLIYAVLMLFYPFAALILGAAGFDAEYRQGAWAYLFSRPVRKTEIWLAKFTALLSMLAALWLVFVALWIAVPGIREIGAWPMLGKAELMLESEFPWWSILLSGFLLTVAFSLSLLYERQFNILFVSLGVGFSLPAAAWAVMSTRAGGFLAWIEPERAVSTFFLFLALVALAFAAASVLTLVRSDFSQPRRQILGFIRRFALLLGLALAGTAAFAVLSPVRAGRRLWSADSYRGEPYYITERGLFKYSAEDKRIHWLTGRHLGEYFLSSANLSGKIACAALDVRGKKDVALELWVMNTDGSGRTRLIGRDTRTGGWAPDAYISDMLVSPDGKSLMLLSDTGTARKPPEASPLWRVNMDGTGLENLPTEPALAAAPPEKYWLQFVAWVQGGNGVLIHQRSAAKPSSLRLWIYDVKARTARLFLDNAYHLTPLSPSGKTAAIRYGAKPGEPWKLALLDLETLGITDLDLGRGRVYSRSAWDAKGERLAVVTLVHEGRGADVYALAVYSLAARKAIAERAMTQKENLALLLSPSWTSDGQGILILDRESRSLKVLGPDLAERRAVPFPKALGLAAGLEVVGDQALVIDGEKDTLWRCDLVKKTWKRLY